MHLVPFAGRSPLLCGSRRHIPSIFYPPWFSVARRGRRRGTRVAPRQGVHHFLHVADARLQAVRAAGVVLGIGDGLGEGRGGR